MAKSKKAAPPKKAAPKKSATKASGKKTVPKKSAKDSNNALKSARSSGNNNAQGNSQLEKYFHDALKDIYWAEKHLTKALSKMKKAATTTELKSAIDEHLEQTKEHVTRLEQVFEIFGKKAQAKKCDAMEGLVKEGESIIEETEDGSITRDVGIIMAAQKVEHYEIATYGGLVQLSKVLGLAEASEILSTTLEEEKTTDSNLSEIAENKINWEAENEDDDEEDDEDSMDNEDEDE